MHHVVVSSCIVVRLSFMDLSCEAKRELFLTRLILTSAMIKKRTRPQPRVREISPEVEESPNTSAGEKDEERLE